MQMTPWVVHSPWEVYLELHLSRFTLRRQHLGPRLVYSRRRGCSRLMYVGGYPLHRKATKDQEQMLGSRQPGM